jgi:hypothetical protein
MQRDSVNRWSRGVESRGILGRSRSHIRDYVCWVSDLLWKKRKENMKTLSKKKLKDLYKRKKILCVQLSDDGGDGPKLWRVDEKGAAQSLFDYLYLNYDFEVPEAITMVEMTAKEWKEAEKRGAEYARIKDESRGDCGGVERTRSMVIRRAAMAMCCNGGGSRKGDEGSLQAARQIAGIKPGPQSNF